MTSLCKQGCRNLLAAICKQAFVDKKKYERQAAKGKRKITDSYNLSDSIYFTACDWIENVYPKILWIFKDGESESVKEITCELPDL